MTIKVKIPESNISIVIKNNLKNRNNFVKIIKLENYNPIFITKRETFKKSKKYFLTICQFQSKKSALLSIIHYFFNFITKIEP